ncbi:hypothetical protein [Micromonospora coxensis]|uniref:Uncharacterized protein n=1 Tax=Micromonospora coxensis TaxID=356852 RepID=A0A1C5IZ37_9ACTN|nr:hypothetical protein [Micromonospora coxensis]SCG63483.1 hypothetical protein GA0070614_3652 [Micromonospora coxensis]
MEIWSHGTELYEVNSYYSVPDDAWQYELTGMSPAGGHLSVVIPDATPDDGPFTPQPAHRVLVQVGDRQIPWPIFRRFIDLVESSGDLAEADNDEPHTSGRDDRGTG